MSNTATTHDSHNKYYAVANAGSSSYKFSLFAETGKNQLELLAYGEIEGVGTRPIFNAYRSNKEKLDFHEWDRDIPSEILTEFLIDWIEKFLAPHPLHAIGHRMLHGGTLYRAPVKITPNVLYTLKQLVHLAPLHQPRVLNMIDIIVNRYPDLCQIVCFDTAFHKTNPYISQLYGLPHRLVDRGIIRYGFHGISYEFISQEMQRIDPATAGGRVIVAHLGSGASMCGLVGGNSVASTMGFTALDGLIMGTRCGALDPGVVLYLLQNEGLSIKELESLLYKQSGLLGISGISNDVRDLLASNARSAKIALDVFTYRVVRETGSLVAACGGLDALVFTAGIGERSSEIRAAICDQLDWLGVKLDYEANRQNRQRISTPDSPVSVWVLHTNEELMIARHITHLYHGSLTNQYG